MRFVELLKDGLLAVLIMIVLLLMKGCATPEPTLVPIAVPCKVQEPLEPTYRFSPPYGDIFSATRDLLGDREVALAYEAELRLALRVCTH